MAKYTYSIRDAMRLAEKRSGIAGWVAYRWAVVDGYHMIDGCVPDGVYKSGPRKGEPRFTRNATHRRTVVLSEADLAVEAEHYERVEGNCWTCKGIGSVVKSINVHSGTRYRLCNECNGGGRAKQPA